MNKEIPNREKLLWGVGGLVVVAMPLIINKIVDGSWFGANYLDEVGMWGMYAYAAMRRLFSKD